MMNKEKIISLTLAGAISLGSCLPAMAANTDNTLVNRNNIGGSQSSMLPAMEVDKENNIEIDEDNNMEIDGNDNNECLKEELNNLNEKIAEAKIRVEEELNSIYNHASSNALAKRKITEEKAEKQHKEIDKKIEKAVMKKNKIHDEEEKRFEEVEATINKKREEAKKHLAKLEEKEYFLEPARKKIKIDCGETNKHLAELEATVEKEYEEAKKYFEEVTKKADEDLEKVQEEAKKQHEEIDKAIADKLTEINDTVGDVEKELNTISEKIFGTFEKKQSELAIAVKEIEEEKDLEKKEEKIKNFKEEIVKFSDVCINLPNTLKALGELAEKYITYKKAREITKNIYNSRNFDDYYHELITIFQKTEQNHNRLNSKKYRKYNLGEKFYKYENAIFSEIDAKCEHFEKMYNILHYIENNCIYGLGEPFYNTFDEALDNLGSKLKKYPAVCCLLKEIFGENFEHLVQAGIAYTTAVEEDEEKYDTDEILKTDFIEAFEKIITTYNISYFNIIEESGINIENNYEEFIKQSNRLPKIKIDIEKLTNIFNKMVAAAEEAKTVIEAAEVDDNQAEVMAVKTVIEETVAKAEEAETRARIATIAKAEEARAAAKAATIAAIAAIAATANKKFSTEWKTFELRSIKEAVAKAKATITEAKAKVEKAETNKRYFTEWKIAKAKEAIAEAEAASAEANAILAAIEAVNVDDNQAEAGAGA